ncbi:hypothetical protein ABT083_35055 [Streptomyces goshikiensis]|uniref:hypothetical protein n=1 Tax=Streptomyces goshikiensis TaxID=1942 RepID=UPI0033196C31
MTPTATPPAAETVLDQPVTRHARRQVGDLFLQLRLGVWTPAPLEQRIAGMLSPTGASAGAALTSRGVRTALWEGALTMTQENGGHFATVLAHLVTALDDPEPNTPGLADTAAEFFAAVADHR